MADNLSCLILAGGLGTRLGNLVKDAPKPMLRINNRPFLEYLIYQVRLFGMSDIVLCVGYKREVIEDYFSNGKEYGVRIRYSREQELLGTAGAIAHAGDLINSDPFVVMNGDSFCEVDFKEQLKQHKLSNAAGTIAVTRVDECSRYNCVAFDKDGAVISFRRKREISGSGYINGGIYILKKTVLDYIPMEKSFSLENDLFPELAQQGLRVFKSSGTFIDIGVPYDLKRAEGLFYGFKITDEA